MPPIPSLKRGCLLCLVIKSYCYSPFILFNILYHPHVCIPLFYNLFQYILATLLVSSVYCFLLVVIVVVMFPSRFVYMCSFSAVYLMALSVSVIRASSPAGPIFPNQSDLAIPCLLRWLHDYFDVLYLWMFLFLRSMSCVFLFCDHRVNVCLTLLPLSIYHMQFT